MDEDLKIAMEVLREGGIILYPTDTIWGIGCDATNPAAVQRVYQIKKRADNKSMLVLVDSESRLMQYVDQVPEVAWQLIGVSIKPLTIIYQGAKNLAPNLIAENGSVGIRIPRDDFCRELISRFRKPVVSTSANISGHKAPALFPEIEDGIISSVDYVVNWRRNDLIPREASSVIELRSGGEIRIIRE